MIDPEEPFAQLNVRLHGIDEAVVRHAPTFPSVMPALSLMVAGRVVASHMAFDRVAMHRVCCKYGIPPVSCAWLDTARVARRAWPRFARRGYGLKSVASWCGIEFEHHNAVEDARAAGRILVQAVSETGIGVDTWLSYPRVGVREPQFAGSRR